MPDAGLLTRSALADPPGIPSEHALQLEDAQWVQVTFEVDQAAALAYMPAEVTRPIPCYARLLVAEGSTGRERLALAILGVGGRFRMMARNMHVDSLATGGAAAGTLTSQHHRGAVTLTRTGLEIAAAVDSSSGGVANIRLPQMYEVEPSMLRWDPWLTIAATPAGAAAIAEVAVSAAVGRAYLSKAARVELNADLPRAHPWQQLRNLQTISACYAEGSLLFGPPVIQQELA